MERSVGSPNDAFGPTGEWEHLLAEEGGAAIELRDGEHVALVRLADAYWTEPAIFEVRYETELTERQRAFLARHQVEWKGYWKPMLRFFEHMVQPGQPLMLFGVPRAERAPDDGGAYRAAPPRLVFAADAERPLVVMPVGETGDGYDDEEYDDQSDDD